MDHKSSVRKRAAERYLLGELPPAESQAFEEHFFECLDCAEEVRLGREFAENANAVFEEDGLRVDVAAAHGKHKRWLGWIRGLTLAQAAGCATLVGVIGYENAVLIPQLRSGANASSAPEAVASAMLTPTSRGATRAVSVAHGAHFVHIALELGDVEPFENYVCDLRSGSGAGIRRIPIPTLDPVEGIHLVLPANILVPGFYDAVLLGVSGVAAKELARYHFEVRR